MENNINTSTEIKNGFFREYIEGVLFVFFFGQIECERFRILNI